MQGPFVLRFRPIQRRFMSVFALAPRSWTSWSQQLRSQNVCSSSQLRSMSSGTVARLTGALEESIQETEPIPAPNPPRGWTTESKEGSKALIFRNKATAIYLLLDDIEYEDEADEEAPTAFGGLKNIIGGDESEPSLDAVEKFHFSAVIEAVNSGRAIMFDCTWAKAAHEGEEMVINHVVPFHDLEQAHTVAAEAKCDQNLYEGPALHQIDEEISDLFHIFLEERGFNEDLFSFMIQQASHKEFLEDKRWMQNAVLFMKSIGDK